MFKKRKGTMANEKNLRPCEYKLSQEEAKKGGINSAKARREKKSLQELMKMWFEMDATGNNKKKLEDAGMPDLTNKSMMILALAKNIAKGDIKSIQYAAQLAQEDAKRELENKKLREEIEKLKLEQELLKQEQETGIIIEDTANLAKMLMLNDTENEYEKEETNDESESDSDN